jgi:2-phosphosulfolactate phosphatase
MIIDKTDFVDGAQKADGIVVVIDVFRAFSVTCYCLEGGAKRIIPVGNVEMAHDLNLQIENSVLIGERKGKRLPGFDLGNSPTEVRAAKLQSKTIIHTTHAGTQGLVNATKAQELLTGAFVNARATANYIKSRSPEKVTLVRMGLEAIIPSDEDNLCADYLEYLLLEKEFDEDSIKDTLKKSPFSNRFFDPEQPWTPLSDFELCLDINAFDFAIKADFQKRGHLSLRKA